MEDNRNILGILSSAIGEYLNLRTDDFRKNIIESLSVGFSRVLAILVITMLSLIVLAVFAFAFIVLLGQAIGTVGETALIETTMGPHVHFSVTYQDLPMDPAEFLSLGK